MNILKPGDVYITKRAFDVVSVNPTTKITSDEEVETIRIKRVWSDEPFTILSVEFKTGRPCIDPVDFMNLENVDRLITSILYQDNVWWAEIVVNDLHWYEKII